MKHARVEGTSLVISTSRSPIADVVERIPYGSAVAAYKALDRWMKAEGHTFGGSSWRDASADETGGLW